MHAPGMEQVALVRVDDRLVHGQVVTSWTKATGANKIMVVDDEVAKDDLQKAVLKGVLPSNVKMGTFTVKKAVDRLVKGLKPSDKVIILVKTPETVARMQDAGIEFKSLNIGGMGFREGRTTLYQNIACSEDERAAIKKLIDAGCDVNIQIVADAAKVNVAKII